MFRSLASPALVVALTTSVTMVGTGLQTPADAATGDVLSLEWHTQSASGGAVTSSAGFVAYGDASSAAQGGAKFTATIAGSLKSVTVAPPAGSRFAAGRSYAAGYKRDDTTALLQPSTNSFSTTLCAPLSTSGTFTGTVTVLASQYDDAGALTAFAADFRGTCTLTTSSKATEYVSGSLRHGSAEAWLVQKASYVKDTVPVGRQRSRPVTVTATASGGKTITVGAASLTGVRASDYQVASNGCAGRTLGDGDSCTVDVAFAPAVANGSGPRVAMLSLAAGGHVSDAVRVRLDSTATALPGAPRELTTYPTADGVGISWEDGWSAGDPYLLERRWTDAEPWTALTTVAYGGSYNYVDHDTAPGRSVEYRVTGSRYGWEGPPATTSTVRATSVPTPGPDRLVSYGSTNAAGATATVTDGLDGGTVTVAGGGSPVVTATAGDPGSAYTPAQVSFPVPILPGPGTYPSPAAGSPRFNHSAYNCSFADVVLEVRSVAYDESRRPLVLDASWVGRCAEGTVVRVEIRLGTQTQHALLTADPPSLGRFTTWAGRAVPGTVTVTSAGPGDVTLGAATTTGTAADDWTVTDNGCAGRTLHTGDTCPVTVRFSNEADNARPAVLRIAGSDVVGPVAPVLVPLDGWGATPPTIPSSGLARGTIGAVLSWWGEPYEDGGRPVLSYDVQRRPAGSSAWSTFTSVPAGPYPSFVDRAVGAYDYRVRAVNEVGPGPWSSIAPFGATAGNRAVVVSGSTSSTGPLGLFQVDPDEPWAPYLPLTDDATHDYRTPAVSPGGSRLAASVSIGDGSDGEYDLWSGTLARPTTRQLTTMPGTETEPSYSPDADRIAFTHVAPDGSPSVWVVPALGGQARLVRAEAADPAWSFDGIHLLVEDRSAPDQPLLVVDVTTGEATALANTEAGKQPAVSRTGAVAYVDASGRVLEIPAGLTMPQVKASAPYSGVLGRPAYDDKGRRQYETTRIDSAGVRTTAGPLNARLARVGEPAPVLADLTDPWLERHGLADTVRGTQAFSLSAHDLETPESVLRPMCRLDGAAWRACAGAQSFAGLSEGQHTLDFRVTDEAGNTTSQRVPFTSDTVPPTLSMTGPGRWLHLLSGTPTFSWEGRDGGSGAASYETRARTATPTTGYTAYRAPKGYASTDSYQWLEPRVAVGQEYCVRVRVQDLSGLWSPYVIRCASRPLDDASLTASSGWRRVRMTGLYQRTESTTSRKGVTLRTEGAVTTRRIGVVASTCPTCGSVAVYVGSRYVGKVSLVSSRRRDLQLLRLPLPPQTLSGRLVLKTLSSRPVRIDGLSLARS